MRCLRCIERCSIASGTTLGAPCATQPMPRPLRHTRTIALGAANTIPGAFLTVLLIFFGGGGHRASTGNAHRQRVPWNAEMRFATYRAPRLTTRTLHQLEQ